VLTLRGPAPALSSSGVYGWHISCSAVLRLLSGLGCSVKITCSDLTMTEEESLHLEIFDL